MKALAFFRGAVTENVGLKAISLVVAIVLYAMVHGSQDTQHTLEVRLDALPPPKGGAKILMTSLPPRVRVTVRGPKIVLDDVHADELGKIEVDLRQGTPKRVLLDANLVKVPPGLSVEQIEPAYLELDWEDRVERDVPILVSVSGTPPAGLVVKGAPKVEPAVVHVDGPRSLVLVMQNVRAEPFDVSQVAEGDTVRLLPLDQPPPRATFDQKAASVTLKAAKEIVERAFDRLEVSIVGVAKAKSNPSHVDVRLACAPLVAKTLRAEQVVPFVEVPSNAASRAVGPGATPSKEPGSLSLPVNVKIPGCEATVVPSEVVVRW